MAYIFFSLQILPLKPLEHCDSIYIKVCKESCELSGMHIDQSTIDWWNTQDADIRREVIDDPVGRVTIKDALTKLKEWVEGTGCKLIWSHGDDFDCVILKEAYDIFNMKPPWDFWNTRDTRTLYDIANVNFRSFNTSNKHHPLHDCYNQILALRKSFNKIKIN